MNRTRYQYSSVQIIDAGQHFGLPEYGLDRRESGRTVGPARGYVLGEEAGGAFIGGLRHDDGTLFTKNAGDVRVFWQGPTHHLRFTQKRALGRKVSDEFTVPLCRGHHRELHRCGDEAAWWTKLVLDPIAAARAFWVQSHPLPEPMGVVGPVEKESL
jgi:hypothetical protein